MADIQAFRALRYDLGRVGSLSDVVAPPYDVINESFQSELYDRHDQNVIRLILNRGDDLKGEEDIYQSAARNLKHWRRDGVLRTDPAAAIYVYHQTFEADGKTHTRRGFMSRIRIEPFGEGKIYPHEQTHSKVKEDRRRLMTACQANLSPIFGIYPDESNEAQDILEAAIDDRTPLTAIDHLGVKHEMWMVSDIDSISRAAEAMGEKPIYIADGHHRYETSTSLMENAKADDPNLDSNHPVNYVMMTCVSMHDPGMIVLPTHRLFRGIAPITSADFCDKVGNAFDCEVQSAEISSEDVWAMIESEDEQGTLGFYCRADEKWVLLRLNASGMELMNEIAKEQSDDWQGLGVALLHNLIIEKLLGYSKLPSPLYVHSVDEFNDAQAKGDTAGRDSTGKAGSGAAFELSCLVMPATLNHVKAISENGERMPAKSTYFYPKLLSGMTINPLN